MKFCIRVSVLTYLMIVLGVLGILPFAHADQKLSLSDGTTTKAVADGAIDDLDPTVGVITFIGSIGSFVLNVTTGVSGGPGLSELNLNSVDLSSEPSGAPVELTIKHTDTGFGNPVTGFRMELGGTTDGTVSYAAYFDTSNAEFGMNTPIGSIGPSSGAFSGSIVGPGPGSSSYSLTQMVTVTHPASTPNNWLNSSFSATLQPVPEPGLLSLLSMSFASVLGYGVWRRKR